MLLVAARLLLVLLLVFAPPEASEVKGQVRRVLLLPGHGLGREGGAPHLPVRALVVQLVQLETHLAGRGGETAEDQLAKGLDIAKGLLILKEKTF